MPPPVPAPPPPIKPPTGAELATAFDGVLERLPVSPLFYLGLLLTTIGMLLLPVVYVALLAGVAWLTYWHAVNNGGMVTAVNSPRIIFFLAILYGVPILAGVLTLLFMVAPLLWRSKRTKPPRPMWVSRREEPLLFAYVDRLCDVIRVPRPHRIEVTADANAAAYIDNGLLGLFRRRLVLSVGLPLVACMDLRQFTSVVAHELGHFAQGGSMRLRYLVQHINLFFFKLAYRRSAIDDFVASLSQGESWWGFHLVALLAQMMMFLARLILSGLAWLSFCFSRHLGRQAEFDADRQAARVAGAASTASALTLVSTLAASSSVAVNAAKQSWLRRRLLPDDLIEVTTDALGRLPGPVVRALAEAELDAVGKWSDSHPPLGKRLDSLKRSKLAGVQRLDCDTAAVLFKDFDDACKMATLDFYRGVLGDHLQPEHLVPFASFAAEKAAATAKQAASAEPIPIEPDWNVS